MVNVTVNGIPVSVPEGGTILDATKLAGCPVPTLCFLKDINEIAACRVCVVELEGADHLITACNNVCMEGMAIRTNSVKVREARRTNIELILSQHRLNCLKRPRHQSFHPSLPKLTFRPSSRTR